APERGAGAGRAHLRALRDEAPGGAGRQETGAGGAVSRVHPRNARSGQAAGEAAMKAQLQRLATRFNALSLRERAIGFASVLLAALVLFYVLGLEPALAKKRRLAAQLAEAQKGVLTLQSLKTPNQDPLAARRAERDALRRQLAEI